MHTVEFFEKFGALDSAVYCTPRSLTPCTLPAYHNKKKEWATNALELNTYFFKTNQTS